MTDQSTNLGEKRRRLKVLPPEGWFLLQNLSIKVEKNIRVKSSRPLKQDQERERRCPMTDSAKEAGFLQGKKKPRSSRKRRD